MLDGLSGNRLARTGLGTVLVGFGLLVGSTAFAQNADITLLNFADASDTAARDDSGGFAALMTLIEAERAAHPNTVTIVSGDFLSPSLLSGLTQGAQMVELFNAMGIDLAGYGNHEFDFGPEVARERAASSEFPWLGANIIAPDGSLFDAAVATTTRQYGDVTVGFVGLLTEDTEQLSSVGDLDITPPVEAAKAAVDALKAQGAHMIVAVTHMTMAEDRALAREVEGIDVILGGHDHETTTFYENGVLIHKSGADARFLGAIDMAVRTTDGRDGPETTVTATGWRMLGTLGVAPEPEIARLLETYEQRLDEELGVVIGKTTVELDSRRQSVRGGEANVGNLIADALREGLQADIGLTNGGGIRGDTVKAAGSDVTRRDILSELPFGNRAVLVAVSGADVLAALENGFSQIEDGAGRFPQVSGMTVTYDPARPAGNRVIEVRVGDAPLDPAATYRVATNDYMARGGDGYDALTNGEVLIDPAAAVLMANMVIDHIAAKGTISPTVEGRLKTAD